VEKLNNTASKENASNTGTGLFIESFQVIITNTS